jgi:hypothetical protein
VERKDASARVIVRRGAWVSGHAIDENGRPLSAVTVSTRDGTDAGTNAEGHFRLHVPADVPVDLQLVVPATSTGTPLRHASATVMPGRQDVVLQARPVETNRRMHVVVRNPDGGMARDADVRLRGRWMHHSHSRVQAADGVHIAGLPGAPVTLDVTLGADPSGTDLRLPTVVGPHEPAGQTVVVQLTEGVQIAGTVLAPDGKPASGVSVSVFGAGFMRQLRATIDGRFRFSVPLTALPLNVSVRDRANQLSAWAGAIGTSRSDLVLRLDSDD